MTAHVPGAHLLTPLGGGTLRALDARIEIPRYERADVTAGVAHVGVGNFHRAHQAMYLDRLMDTGAAQEWGIHGIGVLPADRAVRADLIAQDGLYTLVLRHNDGTWTPRVIGSLVGYDVALDDPRAVLERLCDPRIRIVSLTVTEGGYALDPATGRFDPASPAIAADLVPGAVPSSVFGLIVAALALRRARSVPAFTIVSCDNVQGNGHVARDAVTGFASLRDPDLAAWIGDEVRFPNSMVDRITPQTTDADRAELAHRFGVQDLRPVLCEPFVQWVLEDDFGDGRPPLEDVGVQLVDDVEPYELMKLRLLNAGHQALCYPARLIGHELVHDAATDPRIARFLLDYMQREAIPTLRPVPGVDLPAYARELIERFANPEVRDTVARLCSNTSDLIPKFLLPVVRANLAARRSTVRAVAVIAFWARYAEGVDEQGVAYELADARAADVRAAAAGQRRDPIAFLEGNRAVFGDLVEDRVFAAQFGAVLRSVHEHGVRPTLDRLDELDVVHA